ncbi:hypothetical protein ACEPPN_008045 [Leptodophora sp. 'Broadleaf-Isolate-01']
MLFFFDQNNEVGSIYMVVQGIQSHFLNLFGLLEVRFIPRFACQYLASEEVLEDDPHYMAMSLEAFQELKTEEIILVVGSKELCRGPNLAFRNPSKPPLETLSKQYYEKRMLELGLTDMSQHLYWQQLEDQQLDKIQRVRKYHVRGRKYFTDQGLDPNYQELYNLDNGHSNCLCDPNDWTVKKVTFMEATTAIALKKQTIS